MIYVGLDVHEKGSRPVAASLLEWPSRPPAAGSTSLDCCSGKKLMWYCLLSGHQALDGAALRRPAGKGPMAA